MSVYMTEDEQLESIKKWWQKNGSLVTIVLSLILLGVGGYRYMHWHQNKLTQEASMTYEQMMLAFSNQDAKAVRSYANQLIKDHQSSIYADIAHMTLAKVYASKNKLDKAKDELDAVAKRATMPAIKQIAKIRVARILANSKSYTKALDELATVDDQAYLPVINELKGDIYGATGQYNEAISSYRLAMDEIKINGMGNLFLEMKSNALAVKSQSMSVHEKKIQTASL